ncbi:hypothetical protein VitviT2T_023134 [Vitis vinifera]|uniref:Uncharacterized protein n=1 Tax=Vitis vinifera TaxID=29760 RepID=A0ABY9DC32_VITVI|nr:hypothetical protein VitviT2T_023134 [Vitis vinifera]
MVVPGRTIGDSDLLSSRPDVVFKHGVLICPSEQVVHHFWQLLREILKEQCARIDASLEDLQDGVHTVGLHLEHNLFEPFHEVSKGLILLHLDVLYGAYVLLMTS